MYRLLLFLILTSGLSCHRSIDSPKETGASLYRRWLPTTFQFNDGRIINQSPSDEAITTFVANGTILYGTNGRYVACCSPHRFRRKGNVLDYTDVNDIPYPSVDNPDYCASVNCSATGDFSTILTLSDNKLVIKTTNGVITYRLYL